jgi:hypothetical protein
VFGDEPAQIEKEALPPPNSYGSATVGHLILYNFFLDKCFFIGVEKGSADQRSFAKLFDFFYLSMQVLQEVKLFSISLIFSFKNKQLCVI